LLLLLWLSESNGDGLHSKESDSAASSVQLLGLDAPVRFSLENSYRQCALRHRHCDARTRASDQSQSGLLGRSPPRHQRPLGVGHCSAVLPGLSAVLRVAHVSGTVVQPPGDNRRPEAKK